MNKKKILVWILAVCLGRAMGATESPGARSPIGSPTAVPSAGRTGVIAAQPNLYGYVGNLTMTGNIGGGRHFRGFVPYGSMDYLDNRLIDSGTREVSSFVRRSYGAEPYYDPGRTVTSMQRTGISSGLSSPTLSPQGRSPAVSSQWLASFDLTELLQAPQQRPLSSSARSMEAVVDQQIARDLLKKPLAAIEPVKPIQPGIDLSLPPLTPQIPTPRQPPEQTTGREEKPVRQSGELTIYQRIRQELLKSSQMEQAPDRTEDPAALPEELSETEGADPHQSSLILRPEQEVDPADGRRALKNYPDYQHLAEARAADYTAVGERFLKQGQYYKAADAFELACVWDRNNILLVLARSHALFAAGEYMSSAFYLGQALREEPKLIESRIDWASLLDTRDAFENRLVELSTWQQRSNSAELAFLMGYVLYMDDKLTRAQISAGYALDFMPDNPAAKTLVESITKALNPDPAGSSDPVNP